jgi:hypothetical protein
MPPTDRTLGERLFESASKGYRDFVGAENLPADKRIYMESVIDKRRDPITERSFTPEELDSIRNVITRRYDAIKPQIKESIAERRKNAADYLRDALKTSDPELRAARLQSYKNLMATAKDLSSFLSTGKLNPTVVREGQFYDIKPNIQYEDYDNPRAVASFTGAGLGETQGKDIAIGQTLGRFVYDVDPQGVINIKDTYDFGPGYNTFTGEKEEPTRIGIPDLLVPKRAARMYGYHQLPEGRGRPVQIKLNALAPPKAKAKEPTNWFSRTATALGF